MLLGDRVVDRQQLHRGDPQLGQVADRGRAGEPRVGAAQLGRHLGVPAGETLHVHLVDHGARPSGARGAIPLPVEGGIDHHALGQVGGAVVVVGLHVAGGVVGPVAEERVVPHERAGHRLGVGIDQGLRRIEAMPALRLVGPVHPVRVEGARSYPGQVHVPYLVGALLDPDLAHLLARIPRVVEAERHRGGVLAEEGEVHPPVVPRGPERIRPARARAREIVAHGPGDLRPERTRPRRAAGASAARNAAGRATGPARSRHRPNCRCLRHRRGPRRC